MPDNSLKQLLLGVNLISVWSGNLLSVNKLDLMLPDYVYINVFFSKIFSNSIIMTSSNILVSKV